MIKNKQQQATCNVRIMQHLSEATANMVSGNYNFKINWQEEMLEKYFPIFVMHLPVLQPLATATTGHCNHWLLQLLATANVAAVTAGHGTMGENQ